MPKTAIGIGRSGPQNSVVYDAAGRTQPFHDRYGLFICLCRSGGSSPPYRTPRRRRFGYYCISHLLDGEGWFWREGGHRETFSSGEGVIVPPRLVQDYCSSDADYCEDTVCFGGVVADQLQASGILRTGVLRIGKTRRLLPIMEFVRDPARDAQIRANMALQNLLVELYFENQSPRQKRARSVLQSFLDELRMYPERRWRADEMAEMCNVSYSQFRRLFRSHTGFTPKQYVDRLRVNRAAERLTTTDQTVAEIGADFGYDDPFHFSRRFKQILGISPAHYREQSVSRVVRELGHVSLAHLSTRSR